MEVVICDFIVSLSFKKSDKSNKWHKKTNPLPRAVNYDSLYVLHQDWSDVRSQLHCPASGDPERTSLPIRTQLDRWGKVANNLYNCCVS